jgi:hypothetical protein
MLFMFKTAVPLLVSVTLCPELLVPTLWFAKLNELEERLACAPLLPIPTNRITCCGPFCALSVITTLPPRDQTAAGVKVMLIEHGDPGATEVPHVFVWEKSPLITMLLMLRLDVPVLVRVIDCGELLVPTTVPPKLRPLDESVTIGCDLATPDHTRSITHSKRSERFHVILFSWSQ